MDTRLIVPRTPRCKPETPGAFSYSNIWYKHGATPDESIETEVAAIQSMLREFVQGNHTAYIGSSSHMFRVNFTADNDKSMSIEILYHTFPFTVIITVDRCETVATSTDAYYIKTLIEKVIGDN
jgi:hypothetical protein